MKFKYLIVLQNYSVIGTNDEAVVKEYSEAGSGVANIVNCETGKLYGTLGAEVAEAVLATDEQAGEQQS